ncbi:C-type lectin domain family 6 member A-like isoform X1 [Poecilia formosa]|uniref:C-type lectin domain family 6 member A-like isoform X1 n=2 Tax=Poecilia formosa TaxID=48698 RepID=UPI000443A673|nr:PREDICTED: C-type lectin domain family 6 member A-like isoform X1 [Poecilia formosa]
MTLLTYLSDAIRLPRSANYTPPELVHAPGNRTYSISMKKKKPNWYIVVIGILTGLLATLMSLFIREFVNNKDLMTSLEQMQLAANNAEKLQRILFSKRLDYIWTLCDRTTLQCSRCLPGWKEHASRCFFLSSVDKTWENARINCLDHKGDLAVVHNAEDQAFLTNMTFQFKKANPGINFHSAWIGLQDLVKEGNFFWVNGDKLKLDVRFWRPGEPNNSVATWDTDQAGQDCVSMVPPDVVGPEGWMNNWDDISCTGKRHYICETDALILD